MINLAKTLGRWCKIREILLAILVMLIASRLINAIKWRNILTFNVEKWTDGK